SARTNGDGFTMNGSTTCWMPAMYPRPMVLPSALSRSRTFSSNGTSSSVQKPLVADDVITKDHALAISYLSHCVPKLLGSFSVRSQAPVSASTTARASSRDLGGRGSCEGRPKYRHRIVLCPGFTPPQQWASQRASIVKEGLS